MLIIYKQMGLPFENADYEEDQIGATKIPELTDVVITNLADNEILVYNSSSEVWENQASSTNINDINDIGNVNITNIQDGQRLVYNTTTGKWENSTITDNNTDNLNDLTDTNLTTPFGNNEVLKYNTNVSKWENGNLNLNDINDVNITSLNDGEVLKYNASTSKWENQDNTDNLNELTDVTITSSQNHQVLKYNSTSSKYENKFVNLTELGDTNITTLSNDNILIYKTASQKWEAGNITYTETDPFFKQSPASGITTTDISNWDTAYGWGDHSTQGYLTSANIYDLGGLTWSNVDDNEVIRRSSSTSAEGAGMKLTDSVYTKTISYFNRSNPINIQFGAIDYEYSNLGYNQRIVPHSPLLTSSTDGLYLHSPLSLNNTTVNVGINVKIPTQEFQVGTTLYVDDTNDKVGINVANPNKHLEVGTTLYVDNTNKKVGINEANPSKDLEVLNTMYVDSNTRRVGILNSSPATTLQVGTTLYVNEVTRRVGIGIENPDEDLEVDGSIQIDSANTGRIKFQKSGQTPFQEAEIDATPDGNTSNGGQFEFYTRKEQGVLTKKMAIRESGQTEIYTDSGGIVLLTEDGVSQRGYISHSNTGTNDLTIETASSFQNLKGISFITNGTQRFRIGANGEIGFGANNDTGTSGDILFSSGGAASPYWSPLTVEGLSDVTINLAPGATEPVNGEILAYRANTNKWENTSVLNSFTTTNFFNINSALRLSGSYGQPGDILQSNGVNNVPSWTTPAQVIYYYSVKQLTTSHTSNTGPVAVAGFYNTQQTSGYNMFNETTGVFTAPITGLYHVNYSSNIHDGVSPHLQGIGSVLQLNTGSGFGNYKYNYDSIVNATTVNQMTISINLLIHLTADHQIRHCADVFMSPAGNYDIRGDNTLVGFTHQSVHLVR